MEYDDFEHSSSPTEPDPEPQDSPNNAKIITIGVVVALLIAAAIWYFMSSEKTSEEPPVATATTEQAKKAEAKDPSSEEPLFVLPDLDKSDEAFRSLAAKLSAHPDLVAWLASEGLIRRFVASVDNVSEGLSPSTHLETLAPKGVFQARNTGGLTTIDPASYRRYNAIAAAVSGLDAKATVELYRKLEPLMDEAYKDLGYPSGRFILTLRSALERLADTPVPTQPVGLVPQVSSFAFEDESLEALSPAQKHLIRMGPQNQRAFQNKLKEIHEALGPEPL